ncbi:hypothetical protein D3C81_957780 [compost metagenome]
MLARDLVGSPRPDVVGPNQEEALGILLLGGPVQAPDDLLGRLLSGIDHVLGLLEALVERRVVEQAILLLEDGQHRLARGGSPAAEHRCHTVVDQQLAGLFGEGGPVRGAVFLDHLDLAAKDAAGGVDLVDGELFGLDRPGFRDRHGAGGGMQLADGDLGIGDGEPGGVHRAGGQIGAARLRGHAGKWQRGQGGEALHEPAAGQGRRGPVLFVIAIVVTHDRRSVGEEECCGAIMLWAWGARPYVIQRSRAVRGARHISCIGSARPLASATMHPPPCRAFPSPSSASARSGATTTAGSPTKPWRTTRCGLHQGRSGNGAHFGSEIPLLVQSRSLRWKPSGLPSRSAMALPTRCGPSGWSALSSS